jgi:hypothetical protein
MDKKVVIGLCLVGSLVVTLSAPAYANQGGPGATGDGSNPANTGSGSNPSNTGNGNTGGGSNPANTGNGSNNNGGGTSTVQTPTKQVECSATEFLAGVFEQNFGNGPCKETLKAFFWGRNLAEQQGKGGGESSNQMVTALGKFEQTLGEILEKLTNLSSGQNPFGSPKGLYQNPYGPTGLDMLTGGAQGNPWANLLPQLPQMLGFGGSQQPGSFFNPVNAYQDYLTGAVGAVRGDRTRGIQDLATQGARFAEQTTGELRKTAQDAAEKSQEGINQLKEFSQQDAGGQEAQNELQALRTLIKLTESGNKINSTGFQTLNEGIQAGNQIDAQGHATTAQLLTQILAAQKLSAEAEMAENQRRTLADNQRNYTLEKAFNQPFSQATKAGLTVPWSSGVTFNFRNLGVGLPQQQQ